MVTAMLESVTGHNQLLRAIKLTGSGTEKWMSYEVQPTKNLENRIGEIQKRQKAAKYVI
jgi:hypothetical protein